ncbi:MAG: hypothetical protein DMG49_15510 [Acidobacteria bacterium]|nr:MAG: hypothetical protein DMG49_15510 [Acidobacteriota bacterium]
MTPCCNSNRTSTSCPCSTRSPEIPGLSTSPASAPAPSPNASATRARKVTRIYFRVHVRYDMEKLMRNSAMDGLHCDDFRRNAGGVNGPRRLRVISRRVSVFLAAILFACSGICLGQKKQKLEKNYRDWLERDVAYIITKDERDTFLKLTTDEAREKFIETFWEIRNPSPGSPANSYKDEIYQRIAFADARFGIGSGVEGWRTDRGRTYITLGPAKTGLA